MICNDEHMTVPVEHDLIDSSCLSQFKQLLFHKTGGAFVVQKATSLKSAQQRVFIVTVVPSDPSCESNQGLQRVEYTHPPPRGVRVHSTNEDNMKDDGSILDAIYEGERKLVLRIWKGSARWWNLNSNKAESCSVLAKAEVAGYRLARHAFEMYHTQIQCTSTTSDYPLIHIPKVVHRHYETEQDDPPSDFLRDKDHCRNPWAVFSYAKVSDLIKVSDGNCWEFCDEFIHIMVKIRKEFGFDEPHPRHGRVCIEDALEYTTNVLDAVVIPIHGAFFSYYLNSPPDTKSEGFDRYQYERFQREIMSLKENTTNSGMGDGFMYKDMIHKHQETILYLKEETDARDIKEENILKLIKILETCIEKLSSEWTRCKEDLHLPPALCHMDLQPQNMILCRNKDQNDSAKVPRIASVLDWEEACLADPRFEILLLCRKVVANREQADIIWHHYAIALEKFGLKRSKMGSIEPWLKLETVHSLLTMCLQGMNLQGGGRNPWEGKSDLWEKITRELHRLHDDFGWAFCNINE